MDVDLVKPEWEDIEEQVNTFNLKNDKLESVKSEATNIENEENCHLEPFNNPDLTFDSAISREIENKKICNEDWGNSI